MWRSEQGMALVAALVTIFLLMGVAAIATFGGYTNLLTSTNLRLATRARAQAEANINEALYRLSSPSGLQEQIMPNLSDPDWQSEIVFNASPGTEQVASIQETNHWPTEAYRSASITTLQYKKNEDGDLIFYNRTLPVTDPPFLAVTLPDLLGLGVVDPLARLLDQTFQALCSVSVGGVGVGEVVGVGNINVGGTLGLCPSPTTPDVGYPVIQIRATGVDDRNAEREFLAEAVRTVQFTPVAPLAAGGNVNLNNNGFIDGVNHHPGIVLTAGSGAGATYGDDDGETTEGYSGLLTLVKDSPDDNGLWFSIFGFLAGVTKYGIANVSLLLKLPLQFYTSFPRIFNRQISATDSTPAWVDVDPLYQALNSVTVAGAGLGNILVPIFNLGIWEGVNSGYRAAIALSATATVQNDPQPPGTKTTPSLLALLLGNPGVTPHPLVWSQGVFTWRNNNKDNSDFLGSTDLQADIPAPNTIKECGPAVQGGPAPLTCRPSLFANGIPNFQTYIGMDDVTFRELLDDPDTDQDDLDGNQAPLGFTYIDVNYTLTSTTASPGTNDFGLIYASGNLDVQGTHTFKGLIFVDGNLTIQAGGKLTVLGAVMVRGSVTNSSTGTMTLLYSREAANRGIQSARPWRIVSWADTAVQNEAQ